MARVLTQMFIDSLRPGDKQFETPDGQVQGLRLVVYPSGVLSWILRFRLHGTQQKYTIGPYPAVTLKDARRKAQKARALIADGVSPSAEKKAERTAAKAKAVAEAAPLDLVESVAKTFIARHAKALTRPRTAYEVERILSREVLPQWGRRRLSSITKADANVLLDGLVDRAPILANRTLSALKTLGRWAVGRGLIEVNVFADLSKPAKEIARERVLDDAEIAALLKVLDGEEYPIKQLVTLLLMLGARRSEIAELRWAEIDIEAKVWKLPRERSKNHHEHVMPLPDDAVALLKALPRFGTSDLVFSFHGERAVASFPPAKARIDKAMAEKLGEPVKPWVLHDLRRTFASGLGEIGVPPHIIEACLNHRSGVIRGIAKTYNRHGYEREQRSALEAWSNRIRAIRRGEAMPENVVQFGQRQGG